MKYLSAAMLAVMVVCSPSAASAAPWDPTSPDYAGRRGVTIHVSREGDNTDGRSWKTAFRTIQAALDAVPDDRGGHTILVRPGTYVEANLSPSKKGAAGAYNAIVCDFDGALGSGATGWALIDSGDPAKGFKSWDWWGPIRASDAHWPTGNNRETFSSIVWDRWLLRRLYTAGGDAGLFWDLTSRSGEGFTVVVEDCVGTGRAFGGGVVYPTVRPAEPSVFRRCYFLALDFVGDTAAVLMGGWEDAMPEAPHAVFEDCTLVHPDNAVALSYASKCARARFVNCRLIVLNFTQPEMGGKSTGILCTEHHGPKGKLHVDLENSTLAGYSLFTPGPEGAAATASLRGEVSAYVQFKQPVPPGWKRLGAWPGDLFARIAPPSPDGRGWPGGGSDGAGGAHSRPRLTKLPFAIADAMESTPVVFQGRPLLVHNVRDDTKVNTDAYAGSMHLLIRDLVTGKEVARFGQGHSLASAIVAGPELNVFASEGGKDWFRDIYRFSSADLKTWKREPALKRDGGEALLNVSVCRDDRGYLMAYESNKPVGFCFKFARSKDLSAWEKVPGLIFAGTGNEYSACPVIRYVAPFYYVIYLHAATPGHKGWISYLARSRDLTEWELSPLNPILEAADGEGLNNSDVDILERDGKTYLYYATGDQSTWSALRVAEFDGPLPELFRAFFPPGHPTVRVRADGTR
ncbi:hypothetical protein [Aquisphaera insulae]|uniref:hypothetical protein n=1 Tax=Aquisphaera insulae TaxID=2712864 RepID=UPI0013EDD3A6|nr:hypothetical protein [Aquisphaera insulae]